MNISVMSLNLNLDCDAHPTLTVAEYQLTISRRLSRRSRQIDIYVPVPEGTGRSERHYSMVSFDSFDGQHAEFSAPDHTSLTSDVGRFDGVFNKVLEVEP